MNTIKIMMFNLGDYDGKSEHAWLVSNGYSVFSINKKSNFSDHLVNLNPEFIFINSFKCIQKGIDVCIYIKSKMPEPAPVIIFFSERTNEDTHLNILKSGANEYFIKTVSKELFLEKIKGIIEKHVPGAKINYIPAKENEIIINRDQFCIFVKNQKHYLPRLQFNLLELLMSQPNKTFSYEEIEMHIFGNLNKGNNIKVYVSKIKKITGSGYIRNIPEKGYVFMA